MGFPDGSAVKKFARNAADSGLIPGWVRKILWRSKWQPTPVFLPEKSHGQRSLAGYCPQGHKELDTTEWAQNSEILQVKILTEGGSSWPPGTLHLSLLLQQALLFSPLPETSFSWHMGLLKWPGSWSGSLDILPWLSPPHALRLIADLSVHLSFLNVVLFMSQPLTARRGPVSCCTSHPCTQRKGHLRTRCSSWLPTLLGDRRQALWGSCCQWWLQREAAAQFSKPHCPWHSTNRTWFFIYCWHGNLGCWIKMTTWRSSKVAPPWQVPGVYCELLSLSLSRPGNVAWIPRRVVADSLRGPCLG